MVCDTSVLSGYTWYLIRVSAKNEETVDPEVIRRLVPEE